MTTFGHSIKGEKLRCGVETLLYARACSQDEAPCAMHHLWVGGHFKRYAQTRFRYYSDDLAEPAEISLGLGTRKHQYRRAVPNAAVCPAM